MGGVTGKGGDFILVDDPHDPKRAASEVDRKSVIHWWDQTLYSRLNDLEVGVRIIIMQRLHEEDLTGYVLEKNGERIDHICIPGENGEGAHEISPKDLIKFYDKDGLFFPQRFSRKILDDYRIALGSIGYANQILQSPAPDLGIIYQRPWFQRRWKILPDLHEIIFSWDMAFKDAQENSMVVGQAWGRRNALYFLLDQIKDHLDFIKTIKAVINLKDIWPKGGTILVEDKANGPAIIKVLEDKIPGIIPVPKLDSKEAMAHSVTPAWESGNIILPDLPWVSDFIEEHVKFPNSKYDDQCDASAQAIKYFMDKPGNYWKNIIQL